MVNEVFAKVASKYDQMNDLMSFGLHRLWKDDLVAMLNPPHRRPQLRGARSRRRHRRRRRAYRQGRRGRGQGHDRRHLTGHAGRGAAADRPGAAGSALPLRGDQCRGLAFRNGTFDALTVSFGIRNVTDIGQALGEAERVLRPGGRFLCLEFSRVDVRASKRSTISIRSPRSRRWARSSPAMVSPIAIWSSIRRFPDAPASPARWRRPASRRWGSAS